MGYKRWEGKWIVLRHEKYKEIIANCWKNPDNHSLGPAIWHVEPLSRFENDPPRNTSWIKFEIVENAEAAFNLIKELDKQYWQEFKPPEVENGSINRFDILKRDGFRCQLCGRDASDGVKLEIDHKIPKSKGGPNTADNLWVLCYDCNRSKRAKFLE